MPMGKKLSAKKRAVIVQLIKTGRYGVSQIATQTGTSRGTVLRVEVDIQQRAPRSTTRNAPLMGGKLGTYVRRA